MERQPANTGYLTAKAIAEVLSVRPSTIMTWYREGRIPGRKLGYRTVRFDLNAVLAAFEAHAGNREG